MLVVYLLPTNTSAVVCELL